MTQATETAFDTGGALSMAIGAVLWIFDKMHLLNVNDVLTGISLFIGIIWVFFKIRNEVITYKINKKKLDSLKKNDESNGN